MIDIELLAGAYLRAHPAVVTRVVGRTPEDTTGTWIRLQQLDARAVGNDPHEHLIDYLLQFDIYAGGRPELWPLAIATRDALRDMPGARDGAVVTAVQFSGMARIPDTAFKPARERVVLTASIFAHQA